MDAAHASGAGSRRHPAALWFDRPLRPVPAAYQMPTPARTTMTHRISGRPSGPSGG